MAAKDKADSPQIKGTKPPTVEPTNTPPQTHCFRDIKKCFGGNRPENLLKMLNLFASFHGLCDGHFIHVLQIAAHRDPHGDPCYGNSMRF